jgi:hypothetical protein
MAQVLIYQSALVLKIFDPNHTNFPQKRIRFWVGRHDKIHDVVIVRKSVENDWCLTNNRGRLFELGCKDFGFNYIW